MQEITDQKNSEYGHFSRSENLSDEIIKALNASLKRIYL